MAEKLGLFNQLMFGDWAQRGAINKNAEDLSLVEANLGELRDIVQRQAAEITQLRAMFMGVVEVLNDKVSLDDAELERAVQAAYARLTAVPEKPQAATDPYRGLPAEPASAADIEAAKALLASAQDHHFSRRFPEAREIYQQIVDRYGNTKLAATARQQLDNLRKL